MSCPDAEPGDWISTDPAAQSNDGVEVVTFQFPFNVAITLLAGVALSGMTGRNRIER